MATEAQVLAPTAREVVLAPDVSLQMENQAYAYFEESHLQAYLSPECFAIVRGVIAASDVFVLPSTDPMRPWFIATRYTFQVSRSWRRPLSGTIEVWVYGGVLPESVPEGPYPRAEDISIEAYPEVNSELVLGLFLGGLAPGDIDRWRVWYGAAGILDVALPSSSSARLRSVTARILSRLDAALPGYP